MLTEKYSHPNEHLRTLSARPMSELCLIAKYVGNVLVNLMYAVVSLNALRHVRRNGTCFFQGSFIVVSRRYIGQQCEVAGKG